MWQATISCDRDFDDRFFYAVRTVGAYCRPSCRSKTPLRKNVRFFETREEAEQAGFRPCKRCRPDMLDHGPAKNLAQKARELIDEYFRERARLKAKMRRSGISANHLSTIFKRYYALLPMEYLNRKRFEHAQKLLRETDMPIIDVAADTGFDSLSAFYVFFRKHAGVTPKNFRVSSAGGGVTVIDAKRKIRLQLSGEERCIC